MARRRRRSLTPKQVTDELAKTLEVGALAAAEAVRARAVRLLNRTQPTRRTRGGYLLGLLPSQEGEPPKRLSGALIQSLKAAVVREGNVVRGVVQVSAKYGARLEYGFVGTDSAGRRISQGARPFLRPAFEMERRRLAGIMRNAAKRGRRK